MQTMRRNGRWRMVVVTLAAALVASSCVFVGRVSLTSAGGQGFDDAEVAQVSSDGRYVLFVSEEQFAAGDTNSFSDVYLRDMLLGETTLISSGLGTPPNGPSYDPSMSSDASTIAFTTDATNIGLFVTDTNGQPDVVVVGPATILPVVLGTRSTGLTTAATADGASTNADVSDNGAAVVWESTATDVVADDTNGVSDIFRTQLTALEWERVSVSSNEEEANGGSYAPDASFNASRVIFSSDATNLIAGGENNGFRDIYRRNGGNTELISRDANGFLTNGDSDNPTSTALGTRVTFESAATDLVSGDTNGIQDVFYWNNGPISRVSVADDGSQLTGGPGHTLEGIGGTEPRILWSNGQGSSFVRDVLAGWTELVTADRDGVGVSSTGAALAFGGNYVAFGTTAALTGDDTNGVADVYVRAFPNPVVTSASPSAEVGATTTITISGQRLDDVSALLSSATVSWTNLISIDDTTLQADVTVVAGASPGTYGVSVLTPDGGPGQYSGAFASCNCLVVVD